jgi:BirA family biotin operon repressor/biotin-[acetyl-CoA-carboxylase] ligase
LYPTFLAADKQFFLNMAVSLAVRELCEEAINDEIRIKWPNDIYHKNKKLAGILIENTISGSQLASSVIGIGLNVNQTEFDPNIPNPTSLKLVSGQEQTLEKITHKLSVYLEKYYLQLRKDNQEFRGEIVGVTKEGKLIIESNGKQLKFGMKEVEYL